MAGIRNDVKIWGNSVRLIAAAMCFFLLSFPLSAENGEAVSNSGSDKGVTFQVMPDSVLSSTPILYERNIPPRARKFCGGENCFENVALKTNLLAYAVLMPNISLEVKFARRWSTELEWQVAWWSKEDPRKVYRISMGTGELRYWPIIRSKWHGMYVGAFGGGGIYDIDNSEKGHEGHGFMTGLSVGYMWPIGKYFSLDAGLGVGYMRLRDKTYIPLDGHFLYQMTKNINYFGPLRAKLSLVWRR